MILNKHIINGKQKKVMKPCTDPIVFPRLTETNFLFFAKFICMPNFDEIAHSVCTLERPYTQTHGNPGGHNIRTVRKV